MRVCVVGTCPWPRYVSALIVNSLFFNDTATTEIYTLSLHDALPICPRFGEDERVIGSAAGFNFDGVGGEAECAAHRAVHLRHAAQAVGVLHAGGGGAAGGGDIACFQ